MSIEKMKDIIMKIENDELADIIIKKILINAFKNKINEEFRQKNLEKKESDSDTDSDYKYDYYSDSDSDTEEIKTEIKTKNLIEECYCHENMEVRGIVRRANEIEIEIILDGDLHICFIITITGNTYELYKYIWKRCINSNKIDKNININEVKKIISETIDKEIKEMNIDEDNIEYLIEKSFDLLQKGLKKLVFRTKTLKRNIARMNLDLDLFECYD